MSEVMLNQIWLVSIHAPREGCDTTDTATPTTQKTFQFTHPGRGATNCTPITASGKTWFQFTHPGRGATNAISKQSKPRICFNSRTPGGVRRDTRTYTTNRRSFNSRTPGGVRRDELHGEFRTGKVSIHAPREGCDVLSQFSCQLHSVSIHAPREGCDSKASSRILSIAKFQFTHPGRGATWSSQ